MNTATGTQIIVLSVSELIDERDGLQKENDRLCFENYNLRLENQRLQEIERKYNDWVIYIKRGKEKYQW